MSTDQYTMQDPTTQDPPLPSARQPRDPPGLAGEKMPRPDHGESSDVITSGVSATGGTPTP